MSKLPGIFEHFVDLEKIPFENINRWLKFKLEQNALENYLANRIFYPQTIPASPSEMEIDLAILREGLRISSQTFYNLNEKKITIPLDLTFRFYPLADLVTAFIDALSLDDVTKIFIKNDKKEYIIGSIATPSVDKLQNPVNINLDGQAFELKLQTLTLFPTKLNKTILTINNEDLEVYGGEFGVFIDLRNKLV